jgi:chromosomal replication initiation ATPase DnaA
MNLQVDLSALMYAIKTEATGTPLIDLTYISSDNFNHRFDDIAAEVMGVNSTDLRGKGRKIEFVWARYFIFDYLKRNTSLSWEKMGNVLNRNHSTALAGRKKHLELLNDRIYKMHHDTFLNRIKQ